MKRLLNPDGTPSTVVMKDYSKKELLILANVKFNYMLSIGEDAKTAYDKCYKKLRIKNGKCNL